VKRQALLSLTLDDLAGFDADAARERLVAALRPATAAADAPLSRASIDRDARDDLDEASFARAVLAWQALAADDSAGQAARAQAEALLDTARHYSAWAVLTEAGRRRHGKGVLFRHPRQVDPWALLEHARSELAGGAAVHAIRPESIRRRDGFGLTDPGPTLASALDEIHYCLLCHKQGTDSCSHGLPAADARAGMHGGGGPSTAGGSSPAGVSRFRRSALGTTLAGCPLEERISEFQTLKKSGHPIAALAAIVVENPMVAATGHRICNDCVKACVYQQQTPVDIPQAETRTLHDVLALPWGFEVYSLLTRWNPMNLSRPLPAPDSGRKVLVAGMGPAGFTLAHHLLNDGHGVVGIDGLKIEPLAGRLSGTTPDGRRAPFEPVRDVAELREPLESRIGAGFGGVAEYGITARWDKNNLTIVRLLLERRERFALFGGVRFGGTLDADGAFALGFDHVALATGAGRPTVLDIPNGLARGVRTASDFLMALQLTGAAKADSLANLQLRLPVVVIGGGLTAIDAATEAQAYYVSQVEKFLLRHESLVARQGEAATRSGWTAEEAALADEFLAHGRTIRAEREAARREGRAPRLAELLAGWGGVTIAYRRRLVDSPAYRLNHEELEKALEEGVRFAEGLEPRRIEVDDSGAASAIVFARAAAGASADGARDAADAADAESLSWPARTVLIAAGTRPNTVAAREAPGRFALDGRHFAAVDEEGRPVRPEHGNPKPESPRVLLAGPGDGRMMSFFGDLHPGWSGNVVKAMASALRGHPVLDRVLRRRAPADPAGFDAFAERIGDLLRARVERVERLTPTIVEVVVRAPLAARNFAPGQFYRLQNYERLSPVLGSGAQATRLAMEGLALTGAWVDRERGLVSTIVLEMGGSSNLCERLQPGEPVVLMGPTGSPTEIAAGETVVLAGGGLGNAVLFSIGAAFRAAGSRVLYFAGYRRAEDRYRVADIESAADAVVWCCDEAPGFVPGRPQDRAFVGNIVEAMQAWADGRLAPEAGSPRLQEADRILAIGSDRMMAAVAAAREGALKPFLKPGHRGIGSVNSPMQCMLKEICGQCLQPQKDPATGKIELVFSCFEQDQPLERVDFAALQQRLAQNSLQEKLAASWIRGLVSYS